MIRNCTNDTVICQKEFFARSFFQRLTGMLTRKFSNELDGIVFFNCNAVHTFGMRFDLDIIFVDTVDNKIVSLHSNVAPWKIAKAGKPRCLTIELPAGSINKSSCKTGDILEFR